MPFCGRDKTTGELTGALRDYLAFASNCLKNTDIHFEPVAYSSLKAALEALYKGEIDCVFPVNISSYDGEANGLLMVNPIMQTEMYTLMGSGNHDGIAPENDTTVALNQENSNEETFLQDTFPEWTILSCPSDDACFQAVRSGKADCILVCSYRIYAMESVRMRYQLTALPTGESMSLSFAVLRSDSALYSILNKTANLSNAEVMDTALASYSYAGKPVTLTRFVLDNWVAILAILALTSSVILMLLYGKLKAEQQANERKREMEVERMAHQRDQEQSLLRELQQREELRSARRLAYTDPLTRVKSKHAFAETEELIDRRIQEGDLSPFAVAMFDVNDLKRMNDTQGHECGDQLLKSACKLICVQFRHSPVFRIGGDEFVAVLEGEDYKNRDSLISDFQRRMEENRRQGGIVIASGLAVFVPGQDPFFHSVFVRADEQMYERKRVLKELEPEDAAPEITAQVVEQSAAASQP